MSIDERVHGLEQRTRLLEARLAELEGRRVPATASLLHPEVPVGAATPRPRPQAPPRSAATGSVAPPAAPRFELPPPPASRAASPNLEDLLGGRVLAWAGGLSLLAGLLFFLVIAISRDWIGQEARTLLAAATSMALLTLGCAHLRAPRPHRQRARGHGDRDRGAVRQHRRRGPGLRADPGRGRARACVRGRGDRHHPRHPLGRGGHRRPGHPRRRGVAGAGRRRAGPRDHRASCSSPPPRRSAWSSGGAGPGSRSRPSSSPRRSGSPGSSARRRARPRSSSPCSRSAASASSPPSASSCAPARRRTTTPHSCCSRSTLLCWRGSGGARCRRPPGTPPPMCGSPASRSRTLPARWPVGAWPACRATSRSPPPCSASRSGTSRSLRWSTALVLVAGWAASGVAMAALVRAATHRVDAEVALAGVGVQLGLALGHMLVYDAPLSSTGADADLAGGLAVALVAAGCFASARIAGSALAPVTRTALEGTALVLVAYLAAVVLSGPALTVTWAAGAVALVGLALRNGRPARPRRRRRLPRVRGAPRAGWCSCRPTRSSTASPTRWARWRCSPSPARRWRPRACPALTGSRCWRSPRSRRSTSPRPSWSRRSSRSAARLRWAASASASRVKRCSAACGRSSASQRCSPASSGIATSCVSARSRSSAVTLAKVFLYDLSSLDSLYRVASFVALGALLLLRRLRLAAAAAAAGDPVISRAALPC